MAEFLKELIQASTIGAVLWIILFCLKPLTRRVFSQTWHYYVNLIPLVFLFGGARWITLLIRPLSTKIQLPISININEVAFKTDFNMQAVSIGIFLVWLVGTIIFLMKNIISYYHFRKYIITESTIFNHKINSPLTVYKNRLIPISMLIGIFKPIIIVPERDYLDWELALILKHEMAHWRRGDIPVKVIILIANAVHWFNPFTYFMKRTANTLCENAVDETVVREMNEEERVAYCKIILSSLNHQATRNNVFLSVSMALDKKDDVKAKLKNILKYKKMKWPVFILSIILAVTLIIVGGLLPNEPEDMITAAHGVLSSSSSADLTYEELVQEYIQAIQSAANKPVSATLYQAKTIEIAEEINALDVVMTDDAVYYLDGGGIIRIAYAGNVEELIPLPKEETFVRLHIDEAGDFNILARNLGEDGTVTKLVVHHFDINGDELGNTILEGSFAISESYAYPVDFLINDGYYYVQSMSGVYVYDRQGLLVYEALGDSDTRSRSLFVMENGRVGSASSRSENNSDSFIARVYDIEEKEFDEYRVSVSGSTWDAIIKNGGASPLLLGDSTGLFEFENRPDGTFKEKNSGHPLFKLLEQGVNVGDIMDIHKTRKGDIIFVLKRNIVFAGDILIFSERLV